MLQQIVTKCAVYFLRKIGGWPPDEDLVHQQIQSARKLAQVGVDRGKFCWLIQGELRELPGDNA